MKIKKKLYIQATKYSFEKDFTIGVWLTRHKSDNSEVVIDIDVHEVELEVPDFDKNSFTQAHIEQLQKMRVEVLAGNELRLQKINSEIASLLAIESK